MKNFVNFITSNATAIATLGGLAIGIYSAYREQKRSDIALKKQEELQKQALKQEQELQKEQLKQQEAFQKEVLPIIIALALLSLIIIVLLRR